MTDAAFTIYQKHPTLDAYRYGPSYTPYAIVAVEKRFTDAELMAEVHRAATLEYAAIAHPAGYKPGAQQRAAIQARTLLRFATANHFDEREHNDV